MIAIQTPSLSLRTCGTKPSPVSWIYQNLMKVGQISNWHCHSCFRFSAYVRVHCDLRYEPMISDPLCDQGVSPITFLENNTYIYIDEWANVGKKPSLEVRFTTVEPRGLLLFTGERNGRYFALEVFDRNLYMVADFGNGLVTRQV